MISINATLWVFRFHNFISKMSGKSQVNLNFADYDKLGLRLFAISIIISAEQGEAGLASCLRAGCEIGRHQKWQCHLILCVAITPWVCFFVSLDAFIEG